ncbi:ABC transporter substrate-binding protein [Herbiconiux ginsengi]|uniref:Peptide/nickel transport system substrate-binding protein n=1 Tax=Herbiconiux ginsengi TaxID=381665 RepID=A0A1H3TDK6_9MICO|nr:ABC transporter substrate-binding protein [Herbiconiux ginsengi]SDZ48180.1 peptide/nickel transport system substrate-binding protein [Herbiconiux ginsengi]
MNTVRRSKLRGRVAVVAALASALVLSACGGSGAGAPAASDKILTFGGSYAPNSLDSSKDFQNPVHEITNEAILHLEPDGTVTEGLATEWGYVGDGNRVFSFTLRDDAYFSDGTPVTGESAKIWLEYFAAAKGPYSGLMGPIDSIDVDGNTVTLNLGRPNPNVPRILSDSGLNWGGLVSPAAVQSDPAMLATSTFGAGPYVYDPTQSVAGDTYTFVPNEHYYDPSKVNWDKIVVRIMTNPNTRLQSLQTGEVDAANGHYSTTEAAKQIPGVDVQSFKLAQQAFAIMDADGQQVPALGDVRVRQALNYAVNREAIAKAVYKGIATPSSELASLDGYVLELEDRYEFDQDKAKELLAEAGYPDGFEMDVVSEDFAGPDYGLVAQAVVENWEEIGIRVNIVPSNSTTDYIANLKSAPVGQVAPQFDRSMFSQYGTYFAPGGFAHPGSWTDPEIDGQFLEGASAADPNPYWEKISERATEEAYLVPIGNPIADVYATGTVENVAVTEARSVPLLAEWRPGN